MQARSGGKRLLGALIAIGAGLFVVWLATRTPRTAREQPAERAGNTAAPTSPAVAADPAASEGHAVPVERAPSEPAPAGARVIALLLERFPDRAPIAHAALELEPQADEAGALWPATDAAGRARVRVPTAARTLRVRVTGFEPAEGTLAPGADELRLALVPSTALFGRVLRADGSPAAGAEVELLGTIWQVSLTLDERYPEPMSSVQPSQRAMARAATDAQGWYVLEQPPRPPEGPCEVRARLAELEARLGVALPRTPEALPDLVLAPPARVLLVRVVDLDGRPIPGARVLAHGNPATPGREHTDEQGELRLTAPRLPAQVFAYAPGYLAREWRHDGAPPPGRNPSQVEEPTALVEIGMEPVGGARVRIVDAETRLPIYLAHCACELVAGGAVVGRSDFEPDRDGLAWVSFVDTYQLSDPPVAPETARLTVSKEGYDEEQVFELDARAPPGPEPIELALRPVAGWSVLRGRVLRAGEPLARFQVGMKVQPRVADPTRPGWQYGRAYTDAAGRFALRWRPEAFEQLVTVFPHWTSWDEFAFLGPLDEAVARTGEHVLELRPAAHVPAVVRGVVRGGNYRYYVALREGDDADVLVVATTINGVPLVSDVDGELRTLLRLPADRRVQVTVGYVGENSVHADGCAPVVHDPAAPVLPLVLELEPLFLRVRGHVRGSTPEELTGLALTRIAHGELASGRSSNLTRLAPDGSFELQAPRGRHELFLIETAPGGWRTIRARQGLDLERDVEGLVIVPGPSAGTAR